MLLERVKTWAGFTLRLIQLRCSFLVSLDDVTIRFLPSEHTGWMVYSGSIQQDTYCSDIRVGAPAGVGSHKMLLNEWIYFQIRGGHQGLSSCTSFIHLVDILLTFSHQEYIITHTYTAYIVIMIFTDSSFIIVSHTHPYTHRESEIDELLCLRLWQPHWLNNLSVARMEDNKHENWVRSIMWLKGSKKLID